MYENMIIAFAQTIKKYNDLHHECYCATPERCKELMTMDFPYLQGVEIHIMLKKIAKMNFDGPQAAKDMRDFVSENKNK